MPHQPGPERATTDAPESRGRRLVTAVSAVGGSTGGDVDLLVGVLNPTSRTVRAREEERLLFLFNPLSENVPPLDEGLRSIVRDIYWSTSGSVTGALRRAITAVNRHLLDHNLQAHRSERCYGGMALAVLCDNDLFLLEAGPAWACVARGGQLRCFPEGAKLSPLGIGPIPDVQLHHVLIDAGDTLLLAPHTLLRTANVPDLLDALAPESLEDIRNALKQLTSDDFAALAARCETAPRAGKAPSEPRPQTEHFADSSAPLGQIKEGPRLRRGASIGLRARGESTGGPQGDSRRSWDGSIRKAKRLLRKGARVVARASGSVVRTGWRYALTSLGYLWHGLAAAGAGVLALGRWLMGAAGTTIRNMLPGSRPVARGRTRSSPPPGENPQVMTFIAIAIPLAVLVTVILAYTQFAAASRFQGLINEAEEQMAQAQMAENNSEEARILWETALEQLERAATLRPQDPVAHVRRDQAREALDQLDGIQRLTLTELVDFGSSGTQRRLQPGGQSLFVLDASEGWVSAVEIGLDSDQPQNREETERDKPVLVHTGQQLEGYELGRLIDCAWVDAEGGRRSSALLVLEEGHRVVSYDPAWRTEDGAPQLSLVNVRSTSLNRPIAVGSYHGQFYILDVASNGDEQIWRYKPEEDAYPLEPEPYFSTPPPEGLEQALDMAIDGHIYVLYQDGTVRKFLGGEDQPFNVQGVPGGIEDVTVLAVDPQGDGTVYLADREPSRIIALSPEGHFRWQYRTESPLDPLEALAVNQARRRLYLIAGGKVYLAALP